MIPISKPQFGDEELALLREVLASGIVAQGPKVAALEQEFARLAGTQFAVAVSSGTTALHSALLAHGIGPGDEVITTPFSFIATATSIISCGAKPVFVDVDPYDLNLDPDLIEDAITPQTKAVMPVHIFGHPARIAEMQEICDDFELALIEDAAQAHGAEHQGKRAGSFGTGCFSFYPTKNMTTGEGGLITTDDDEIAERCRIIRNHGQVRRYHHDHFGLNWRMTDICAAIGLAQLKKLETWNEARIRNAERLSSLITAAQTPVVRSGDRHVFHQYTIRLSRDRDEVQMRLQESGVGTAVHYPIPIHRQQVIMDLGLGDANCPVAEAAADSVLSLPVHPSLTPEDVEHIAAAVNEAARA
jgi:dTDP-4-amino-4,6-dideoxygalactose transaminase